MVNKIMQYILLAVFWIGWCSIHSLLISSSVTRYLENTLTNLYRFYRVFFNIISFVTLIPVLLYSRKMNDELIFIWDGSFIIIQFILFMIAFILFLTGARKYDMMQFLGIRQIQSGRAHAPLTESGKIDMSGVLGISRHPWYLGSILIIWVINKNIYLSTLIIDIVLTVYLIVGTYLEERKLLAICGERYKNYQKNVSMLLPVKWLRRRLNL